MKKLVCTIILVLMLTALCGCEPTDKQDVTDTNAEQGQDAGEGTTDTQTGVGTEPDADGPELNYSDFEDQPETKPTGTGSAQNSGSTSSAPSKKPQTQTNAQTNNQTKPSDTTPPSGGSQDNNKTDTTPDNGTQTQPENPAPETPVPETPGQTEPEKPSDPEPPQNPSKDETFDDEGYYNEVVKP